MSKLYLLISDMNSWSITDSKEQEELVKELMAKCVDLGEQEPSRITQGFVCDSVESELSSAILSGLSVSLVITSVGHLLKHLSPIIIEFMKLRSQKEITINHNNIKITVKGGGNFEKDLDKVIEKIESMERPKIIG